MLRALSVPYRLAVTARRGMYQRGWLRSSGVDVPVVSVGGLTVGGSGKTPAVLWLAQQAAEVGIKCAIVSRGYRGKPGDTPLLLSGTPNVALCGDEPALMYSKVPAGTLIVVHPDRVAAAHVAIEAGAQMIVLDDGLQHARLQRDVDVVLLDARAPLGNGRFLPAGTLRDVPRAAAGAALILLTRSELASEEQRDAASHVARRLAPLAKVALARHVLDPLEGGSRVFAVSGIAKPDDFVTAVKGAGADVLGSLAFPDHHPYTRADMADIVAAARRANAPRIVTTEKDAVRMPADPPPALPVVALPLRFEVEAEATLFIKDQLHEWKVRLL